MFHCREFVFPLTIVLALLVVANVLGDDDESLLIGTWDYVSVTYDGKPFDVGEGATITVSKSDWTIRRNMQEIRSTWGIDSTTSPKRLNQVVKRGNVTFTMRSIYRLDGNHLVLCERDHPDKPRPKRFTAKRGDGQFLIVLQRRAADRPSEDRRQNGVRRLLERAPSLRDNLLIGLMYATAARVSEVARRSGDR